MPRPGIDVEIVDESEGQSPNLDTGQAFFVGATERGPSVGVAGSMSQFKDMFGGRTAGPDVYDAVNAFFSEGSKSSAIVSRLTAAAALAATGLMGTVWKIDAVSPGTWGNSVTVTTKTPVGGATSAGSPIYLSVMYQGVEVEVSPTLVDVDDGIDWSQSSNYVRLSMGAGPYTLPIHDTTTSLASGTNGTVAVGDYTPALARFTADMGPGQVLAPAVTDPVVQTAIGNHCESLHRVGIVDLPDTAVKATLISARASLNNVIGSRLLLACGSWYNYPTDASPSSRVIPMSGVQAGIIARVDSGKDVSAVAAGASGISRRALGLAHVYSDVDRQDLNANGVTLGRPYGGLIRTYGYRTAAGPGQSGNWTFFQESRVVMAIAYEADAVLEEFVFDVIDGKGHMFVEVKNALTGVCMKYYLADALYGATPEQAFRVVCDSSNNPPDTVKLGEVHSTIYLRTSKVAEWIKVEIVKVPTEREVAA